MLALEVEGGLGSIYKELKAISVSWKLRETTVGEEWETGSLELPIEL